MSQVMGTFFRDITVIWGGKKCHYTDLGFVPRTPSQWAKLRFKDT
jgi:hypothetical protein